MDGSVKLGIGSLCGFALAVVLEPWAPDDLPIGFVLLVVAVILGFIAGWQGSKWWMVLPVFVLAFLGLSLLAGYHAI
jgi:hypothetical protein